MSALVEAAHFYIKRYGPLTVAARTPADSQRPASLAETAEKNRLDPQRMARATRLIVVVRDR